MDLARINELGFEKGSKWKSIVLIGSFSRWWNVFIVVQCYVICLLCTYMLGFQSEESNLSYLRYTCDICYLFEVICTVTYKGNSNLKKLRYAKGRGWTYIILDIISLIPFEFLYSFHYIADNKNRKISLYFIQNRLLRIYRIFQLESFYGITVRKAYQYLILMFFQFTSKAILIGHIMACIWVNLKHSVPVNPKANLFIWCETNMIALVILNWSGEIEMFRENWERLLVTLTILIGFILIFVYFYPYALYVSMQLNYQTALYYQKYGKLQCFLRNMVYDPELKEKVLKYFTDFWQKNQFDLDIEILLKNIPLALKKEIFTDIYWEAFRHSELFRDVSRSCKRSLSLTMNTVYYQSGDVIYQKGQEKLKMMFLAQGTVQVMAEENEESPILSFSSGTVFGELSLFLYSRSQALVKCKSYCELQILTMQAVASVLNDYPKDKRLVGRNLHRRITMAKYTQWRKQKLSAEQKMDILDVESLTTGVEDCVKWIKTQWRALWENHERHQLIIKAREESFRLPSWQMAVRPDIKIEFISNYLDLIVLSDMFEEKKDVVCLNTKFPWSIDPSAQFLKIWYYVIMVTAFVPSLLYPFCTAWLTTFPRLVFIISFIITGMFQIDVLLKLLTAIKTKHHIITRFSLVLRQRLQQPTFYLDVLAALPYQLYVLNSNEKTNSYKAGLALHPAILKSHVFITFKVAWSQHMDKIIVFKNSMISFLLVYWFAEAIQLVSIRDVAPVDRMWEKRFLADQENQELLRKYFLSVFRALVTAISISDHLMYPQDNIILVVFCIAKFFFFFFFCSFLASFYGTYTIKIFAQETFQVLLQRINKFLSSIYISSKIANRLMKTLKFQWDYDNADYLSSKISIYKSISLRLRQKIYAQSTYKTLQLCRLFDNESLDLIKEVMESSFLVAIPSGSVLVTCGHTSHTISIIHRGFCQLNSYIEADVSAGLSRSMILGQGSMFPMLSSLCNQPSPVSVVSLSDCEVIMINLEDLLSLMVKYNIFKDVIDVIRENGFKQKIKDIKPAMLSLDVKNTPAEIKNKLYRDSFKQIRCCGPCLRFCCPHHSIKIRKFLKKWEIFYTIYLTTVCVLWPCCFGLLIYVSHVLVPIIACGNIIIAFNICIQFYSPYYNKEGILITHPAFTFLNYLTTTFPLDFICVCPVYPVYLYLIADPYKKPLFTMVLINFVQHYLKLIHIMGFMNNLEHLVRSKYFVRMTKIILMLLLSLNLAVNLIMYKNAEWIFGGPYKIVGYEVYKEHRPYNPDLIRKNNIVDYYLFVAHWLLSNLMTTDYLLQKLSGMDLYLSYVQNFIGTVLNFYLYAWISSNSIFANVGGTIYQEKITSFVKYLEFEKADDKLIEHSISYYNHEWSQTEGENLKKIFERLPIHLHEELVYPLYKPTISKSEVFAKADEGFFKILSMHVTNVYFNRGSVIIFQNESQSDIYFVHKGKCFVYDWFLTLETGSLVGDIKRSGLMKNKVYALTHVEMLKIPSVDFFMILNSFDDLEANFFLQTKNAENFVKTQVQRVGYQLRAVDSRDVLNAFGLQNKDVSFEDESHFEDPENTTFQMLKTWKSRPEEKSRHLIIYPGTWKMKAYKTVLVIVTFCTLVSVPTLMSFGALTNAAFTVIGILDFFWLLVIIFTFRIGVIDKAKGDVITDFRIIAKQYRKRWDGLLIDILALIPFEFIPVLVAGGLRKANPKAVAWLRIIRLLRGIGFLKNIHSEWRELKRNNYLKFINLLLFLLIIVAIMVNIYFCIATEPSIVSARNPYQLGLRQFFAFVLAFEYIINFVASSNLFVIIPDTVTQIIYLNVSALIYPYAKGWIISQVLSILYVRNLATSFYKSQALALESYLSKKDTSPSIVKEVLNYKLNLLLFGRSESMPSFLKKAPTSLRISIMRELYLKHFLECPLFQEADRIFLDQLVARMKREIYFPGQMIVEQHDVDHRAYFIHKGEVYVIRQTKEKAYVEFVVGSLAEGESFGEAQGLWLSLPHVHTYRARTLVEMVVLHSDDWMDLRRNFPQVAKEILAKAKALRII